MIRLGGTQDVSSPASCWKQAKLGDQTRLLWASSSQFLITSKDGNCISSMVKLFPACLGGSPHGRLLCPPEAVFSTTPHMASPPAPWLYDPHLNFTQLFSISLLLGASWLQHPRWSNECWMERDNGFPQPADCALVETADPKHLLQYFHAEALNQSITALSLQELPKSPGWGSTGMVI